MWKVGDVEPVRVMGAEGYPCGFHVTTDDGKLVSFAHAYTMGLAVRPDSPIKSIGDLVATAKQKPGALS